MNASDGTTRAVFLTGVAMLAFAGNSILCRLALRDGAIDPASFTSVRLVSGAVALMVILWITRRGDTPRAHGSWLSACMLFFYAICFSYAYITLSAGAGALILFGFVQGTMIAIGIWSGDRPTTPEWLGWSLAFAGLVWLVLPGVEAPPWSGASLMAVAGSGRGADTAAVLLPTNAQTFFDLKILEIVCRPSPDHPVFE